MTDESGPHRTKKLVKHSLVIAGHRTSISLEDEFWHALRAIAEEHNQSLAHLISTVDMQRMDQNLSSALRVFVLTTVQKKHTP
jgi:predicted DNA-binding ribbon-helix-helix protein